jgi:hypothetical protein
MSTDTLALPNSSDVALRRRGFLRTWRRPRRCLRPHCPTFKPLAGQRRRCSLLPQGSPQPPRPIPQRQRAWRMPRRAGSPGMQQRRVRLAGSGTRPRSMPCGPCLTTSHHNGRSPTLDLTCELYLPRTSGVRTARPQQARGTLLPRLSQTSWLQRRPGACSCSEIHCRIRGSWKVTNDERAAVERRAAEIAAQTGVTISFPVS